MGYVAKYEVSAFAYCHYSSAGTSSLGKAPGS